jgi:hypothetical protein
MPTAPTDDPLAAADRTVGVYPYPYQPTDALKRDALLFDQIAIAELDLKEFGELVNRELFWLRDIGIVRGISRGKWAAVRDVLFEDLIGYIAQQWPLAIPEKQFVDEVVRRTIGIEAAWARAYSIDLRLDGLNAFPILTLRRLIGKVFPSGITPDTTPVLEVIIKSMPIPDDQTAWEDIIEFRNDPESMKRLRRLRVWVRKFAKETTATSLAEMKEEIEVLLDEYEEHMKLHRMKVNKGATETLLTVAGKVAEDLVKLKWGELAKLPFILKERKISLLEAEAKAPNRELAFISIVRERFSR